jgi:hypothetical protein
MPIVGTVTFFVIYAPSLPGTASRTNGKGPGFFAGHGLSNNGVGHLDRLAPGLESAKGAEFLGRVFSCLCTTIAAESPTRIISTPASSMILAVRHDPPTEFKLYLTQPVMRSNAARIIGRAIFTYHEWYGKSTLPYDRGPTETDPFHDPNGRLNLYVELVI